MADTDFLWELVDWLDREGVGDADTEIVVGTYPDDPDNLVALIGLEAARKPDVSVADLEFPRFQVVVRNTDYRAASGKLRLVRELIHDHLMLTTEHFVALVISAEQEGGSLGQDKKGRHEFSINFTSEIRYHDSGS